MRNKAVIPTNSLQAALQTRPRPQGRVLDVLGAATVTHLLGTAEPLLLWGHNVIFPQHPFFLLLSKVNIRICRAGIASLS